ncbi:hypothetical protein DFH28DRAFT_413109 [Melampsora americana]|nr:hypothetical protein DFH28DRAFT_413109 [Melampsora americana]
MLKALLMVHLSQDMLASHPHTWILVSKVNLSQRVSHFESFHHFSCNDFTAISFHDSVRIEGLILSFGQRILQRDYVGAYNVFGRNYIAENKNDLLNTQDSSQNAYDYARAFDKNAFGGRVTTTLRSIHLVTQNPYTIVFQGQLQTTAGQAPNENLDYRSTLVFRGNSPHGGQVVRFSTEIIRFSDGSTPIGHVLNKVPLVGGLLHDLIP